jgi:hypothetical protein
VTPTGLAGGVILEVAKSKDDLALVSTVNAKVFHIHGDETVFWI